MIRILIAEDDLTSRIVLTGVLKKIGYEVVEAINGAAAWNILEQTDAPRLVILDWVMPEMHGLEVVRRVRARQKCALSIGISASSTRPRATTTPIRTTC